MTDEIERVIDGFEAETLKLADWHHREHLIVATHYLTRSGGEEGVEVIRAGIQRYNASQGIEQTPTSGYHDTLTIFLARGIAAFLATLPADLDVAARVEHVVTQFGDFMIRRVGLRYFTRERINSETARRGWVEPDVRPMEEWLRDCREAGRPGRGARS